MAALPAYDNCSGLKGMIAFLVNKSRDHLLPLRDVTPRNNATGRDSGNTTWAVAGTLRRLNIPCQLLSGRPRRNRTSVSGFGDRSSTIELGTYAIDREASCGAFPFLLGERQRNTDGHRVEVLIDEWHTHLAVNRWADG